MLGYMSGVLLSSSLLAAIDWSPQDVAYIAVCLFIFAKGLMDFGIIKKKENNDDSTKILIETIRTLSADLKSIKEINAALTVECRTITTAMLTLTTKYDNLLDITKEIVAFVHSYPTIVNTLKEQSAATEEFEALRRRLDSIIDRLPSRARPG